jgi:predicted HTH transcriptional regulator
MRIYRDVELVESLGSGIPRILKAYGEDCFTFTDNFIRITLPANSSVATIDHASNHASEQIKKLVLALEGEMGRMTLQDILSIKNRDYFRIEYLNSAINSGYIELTIPDKQNSKNQKYRLTAKGIALKESLKNSQ